MRYGDSSNGAGKYSRRRHVDAPASPLAGDIALSESRRRATGDRIFMAGLASPDSTGAAVDARIQQQQRDLRFQPALAASFRQACRLSDRSNAQLRCRYLDFCANRARVRRPARGTIVALSLIAKRTDVALARLPSQRKVSDAQSYLHACLRVRPDDDDWCGDAVHGVRCGDLCRRRRQSAGSDQRRPEWRHDPARARRNVCRELQVPGPCRPALHHSSFSG
jgi:hypothetical protein